MMRMTRDRWANVCAALMVLVMLVVARYTYQDYGITVDENVERKSSIINYQYVVETLTGKELNVLDIELHEWKDRYYGVALQLPMVVVEHLTDFTMPLRDVHMLRHLYNFCVCLAGWVCFYIFISRLFKNNWLGLLGMAMVALYPRFYGESFTNIKDLIFAATCCASMMAAVLCLQNEGKWRYEVLSAFCCAICTNTRFIGFIFPAMLLGYRVLRDWVLEGTARGHAAQWWKKTFVRYMAQIILFFAIYFLVSPTSWRNPLDYLINVLGTFSNYTKWDGEVLYMGKMYPGNALPPQYLLVHVLICTPMWYLALAALGFVGAGVTLYRAIREKKANTWLTGEWRFFVYNLVVAAITLLMPFLKEMTLYNSWRHAYYVFPSVVVFAIFGLRTLFKLISGKKVVQRVIIAAICLLQAYQVGWIIYNHPYEKVYFNPIGRQYAEMVDRDYWYETGYEVLDIIMKYDDSSRITIASDGHISYAAFDFVPEAEKKRFYVKNGFWNEITYYIDGPDMPETEDELKELENFTPVYEVRMKDGLVLMTLHIRNDLLQERFNGVYPAYNLE